MQEAGSSVVVTKIAAATRLLEAAIRLRLADGDLLATHVVASAAFRTLRDVAEDRGHDHLEDSFRLSLYYLGRDHLAGKLPPFAEDAAALREAAQMVGEAMRAGAVKTPNDVEVSIPPALRRQVWKEVNAAYNFLKHADFDASETLDLASVNVDSTLTHVCRLFDIVLPGKVSPAIIAFQAFTVWRSGDAPGPVWMQQLFERLAGLDDAEVRECLIDLCDELPP